MSILFVCSLGACQPDGAAPSVAPSAAPAAPSASAASNAKLYGAPLDGTAVKSSLAEVLARPRDFADKTVLVEGEVRKACSKKGCWMELAVSRETGAPGARVTFKDYGFFVPTDSAGAHARLQGTVSVRTLKASQVEHLEAEGAHFSKKAEDGTAEEVQLVATGVELSRS